MKKTLALFFLSAAMCIFAQQGLTEDVRQALYGAIDQSEAALKTAPFGNKTVAILPIPGDASGLIAGRLKNILTRQGFTCVEGKEDPMWNEIIKEIAWDERKDDILDAKTLVKFGKLKSAQILLYGRIRLLDKNSERVYAELELHATDLATKQHIWGGNFAYRFYKSEKIRGIISLDNSLRMLLKKNFEAVRQSLQSPEFAGKLGNVKTVSVIPLAGDIDQYLTGLAIETLTRTNHQPKNPRIPSLSQLRASTRDGQLESDAVFYGAVRDLCRSATENKALPGKRIESSFVVNADIQLFLEDTKTGVILWSKTITMQENLSSIRPMTSDEATKARQDKFDSMPQIIKEDVADNWKHYLAVAVGVIGAVILLLLVLIGLKAFFSYHRIR